MVLLKKSPGSRRFWNPVLETLPRKKLQTLQLNKFRRILTFAYNHSPFYRRLYREAGLEPGDIKSLEDIRKVPKTEKGMLREAQQHEPFPYGNMLSVSLKEVTAFRQTSGTTGLELRMRGQARWPACQRGIFPCRD
jgi:phenylacetate-CoA ligase